MDVLADGLHRWGPTLLLALPPAPPVHAAGTVLPRGFFLALGLIYLAALALDRLAERLRLPGAAAVLLLGLALHEPLAGYHHIRPEQVETVERISLALLIFFAGLGTDLRRIRGHVGRGLRLALFAVLATLAITTLMLIGFSAPLSAGLRLGGAAGLPLAVAALTAASLTAVDTASLEEQLKTLGHAIGGQLRQLLQFEAALSTLISLLCFGLIAGMFQLHGHEHRLGLQAEVAVTMAPQLLKVLHHLLAGLLGGACVGACAPTLIRRLVRSEAHLLLLAIAVAFVAFGFGQQLGGGGLVAVFVAGMWLSNGRYRFHHFDQHALRRSLHPLNTAAEFTVLLLLGLIVVPANLLRVLPLALLLALCLALGRLVGVQWALSGASISPAERLFIACCGLRGAVPLSLGLGLAEVLPHLRGVPQNSSEQLGADLVAAIFLAVLFNLLLQSALTRLVGHRLPSVAAADATSEEAGGHS
jgi:cell volume regulation protein A